MQGNAWHVWRTHLGGIAEEFQDTSFAGFCGWMGDYPLIHALSPQHRLALFHDLAVGLLLPELPLPPDTLEHHAAFLAVQRRLLGTVEMSIDEARGTDARVMGLPHRTLPTTCMFCPAQPLL